MKHNDIRHMLSEYLDGSLTAKNQAKIEEHLKSCSECKNVLRELQKTIEQVKSIEEIEPPVWLTQKIMTKVHAEADREKSIVQKLFYPLTIKLPLQAVAIVFLVISTFYMYQIIRPEARFNEAPSPLGQEVGVKTEASSSVIDRSKQKKTQNSLFLPKQVTQSPGYKALDMKPGYQASSLPNRKGQAATSAAIPPKSVEPSARVKNELMPESHTAAPKNLDKMEIQEQTTAMAGGTASKKEISESEASLKKSEGLEDKTELSHGLERDIVKRYANGRPELIVSYTYINSLRVMLGEERFDHEGKRQGIQKEFYTSGQLKAEAQYGNGKLEWYREYGEDGVKITEKSHHDWFWLKE